MSSGSSWPCWFAYTSVKGTDNFCKLCELIDGFNESRSQIAYGIEKMAGELMSAIQFAPLLKEIYQTTPIFYEAGAIGYKDEEHGLL